MAINKSFCYVKRDASTQRLWATASVLVCCPTIHLWSYSAFSHLTLETSNTERHCSSIVTNVKSFLAFGLCVMICLSAVGWQAWDWKSIRYPVDLQADKYGWMMAEDWHLEAMSNQPEWAKQILRSLHGPGMLKRMRASLTLTWSTGSAVGCSPGKLLLRSSARYISDRVTQKRVDN